MKKRSYVRLDINIILGVVAVLILVIPVVI